MQDQPRSASALQGRPDGRGGQGRLSGTSSRWVAGLIPLTENLTLGINSSTGSSDKQQASDSPSPRPLYTPQAAAGRSKSTPPAPRAAVRPPGKIPQLQQVTEEASTRSPHSLGAAAGPSRTPPGATGQLAAIWARSPATTRTGVLTSRSASESGFRIINLGIETEVLLAASRRDLSAETMTDFTRILAADHNLRVRGLHPKMRPDLRPYEYNGEYTEWCLVYDPTIVRQQSPCKSLPF
jgi:hypothetical protein